MSTETSKRGRIGAIGLKALVPDYTHVQTRPQRIRSSDPAVAPAPVPRLRCVIAGRCGWSGGSCCGAALKTRRKIKAVAVLRLGR